MQNRFSLIWILFIFTSCSPSTDLTSIQSEVNSAQDSAQTEIEVFMARGYMGGSNYEKLHLKNGILWAECGEIDRKKVETAPAEETIVKLTASNSAEAATQTAALWGFKDSFQTFPQAGSAFSFTGPGILEVKNLTANSSFKTSVDSVANEDFKASKPLLRLINILRREAKLNCTSKSFYGL
ncbi:hypothetical protein JNK13_09090 [bacterium]|nr:hypothetical protein [bacterium]